MNYYNSVNSRDGFVLSCDMIRLKFVLFKDGFDNLAEYIERLDFNNYIKYTFFESRGLYKFRNLFTIEIENKNTFSLGLGFNGNKNSDKDICFIEFNPNKCLYENSILFDFISRIKANSFGLELVRFDLAIDLPVCRSAVTLVKDLRKYKKNYYLDLSSNNLENLTEYLGCRNSNGFVKLYNKKLEQNLNYDLTRLELTLDNFDYENLVEHLPVVYYNKNLNLFEYNELNDTDKVLVGLMSDNLNKNIYFKMLGRVKQEKLKKYIFDATKIEISFEEYIELIKRVKQIFA